MKVLRLAAPVLALALLAGCQQPAVESPSPVPSPDASPAPSYQVTTHWDALNERPTPLVQRRYEGYTDDLIPADDYGQLVPYIGGEASAQGWGTGWYYGLATQDGAIVTAPVFVSVSPITWYDQRTHASQTTNLLCLRRGGGTGESGWPVELIGLASSDGSWYTGPIYRQVICTAQPGVLLLDEEGALVMLDWTGQELWCWAADDIPLPNFDAENYLWEGAWISGPYMRHEFTQNFSLTYVYLDLRNGTVSQSPPSGTVWAEDGDSDDAKEASPQEDGFWSSWEAPTLTIHTEDGQLHTITGIPNYGLEIDGDRVLFQTTAQGDQYALTALDGNVIFTSQHSQLSFLDQRRPGIPSLLCLSLENDRYLLLDRDGGQIAETAFVVPQQWGDRLLFADDTSYRLTDLAGNDLIRLPRLSYQPD